MMDWNGHMSTGGWVFSVLAMIIILALVVAVIFWVARQIGVRHDRGAAAAMSAREILDSRLASGEIEADQYLQLRQTLDLQTDPAADSPPAARSARAAG
jgi:uncharacterized membrane protein